MAATQKALEELDKRRGLQGIDTLPGRIENAMAIANGDKPILDSGERREFQTGSVRDRAFGKGRFDLLPMIALRELALHFEKGAKKYGERNWEKGQPFSVFADSALRHLTSWIAGAEDEDHLIAAAWNIMCLVQTRALVRASKLTADLADLPSFDIGHPV